MATASKTAKKAAPTTWSTAAWATLALHDANLPVTANNVENLQRWITAETGGQQGGWARDNNPLNMQLNAAPPASSATYYTYPTLEDSAQAFADYMGMNNYTQVRAGLAQNAPAQVFSAAVVASPWDGNGHYGGNPSYIASLSPTIASSEKAISAVSSDWVNDIPGAGIAKDVFGGVGSGLSDVANITGLSDVADGVSSASSALGEIGTLAGDLVSPTWWKRIGIGAFGIALIIGGFAIYASQTKAGQQAVSVAGTAAVLA
jgi:hypothetical protein